MACLIINATTKNYIKNTDGRFCCENMPFNPRSLKNLRKIVDITNGKIVLSSSWRLSDKCMTVLEARLIEYGIKIFSKTERLDGNRGNEITSWLFYNAPKTRSVIFSKPDFYGLVKEFTVPDYRILIIDDETKDIFNQFDPQEIIQTDPNIGLDFWKTREAISKFNWQKEVVRSCLKY